MKKLTRKSLDELASVMPVVSEDQQKEFVGGTVYYTYQNETFTRNGVIGSGDNIQILNYGTNTDTWAGVQAAGNVNGGTNLASIAVTDQNAYADFVEELMVDKGLAQNNGYGLKLSNGKDLDVILYLQAGDNDMTYNPDSGNLTFHRIDSYSVHELSLTSGLILTVGEAISSPNQIFDFNYYDYPDEISGIYFSGSGQFFN